MNDQILLEKLNTAPPACSEVVDNEKSRRMGGVKTNYLPSVEEVAELIRAIPFGQTRTIHELRAALAKLGGTETACPAKTLKYWKWMANLSDEVKVTHRKYDIPWWRVLKDGQPSRHMPGGLENQKRMLAAEGIVMK